MTYLPAIMYSSFDIAILIFGVFIKKKNSFKYGLYLIIASIVSLLSTIIYYSIYYPLLVSDISNNPFQPPAPQDIMIQLILLICNLLFLGLGISNEILLVLAFYKIYQTHKKIKKTRE
ncbi:MAG: hypothetical protein ACFFEN_01260 [Candidatus Thorarchaeota archaeon]